MPGDPKTSYEYYEHGPFRLEYLRFGNGPLPILGFHGYGRKCEDLALFAPHIGTEFTLYSFNLFGHGRTRYPADRMEKNTIGKDEWAAIMAGFLDSLGAERAVLLAYSLGGKLALCLIERMPKRIAGAYLFAPDGIQRFFWYRWVSRLPLFRNLIKRRIEDPRLLFRSFHFLHRTGLLNGKTLSFLLRHTRTEAQRRAVYEIWSMHRDLSPRLGRLRRSLEEDPLPLRLFFGRYDPVIPPAKAKPLLKAKGGDVRMHLLKKGHLLLDQDCIERLGSPEFFDDPSGIFS